MFNLWSDTVCGLILSSLFFFNEESPTRGNRRSRIHAFFKRAWQAVKKPFLRCRRIRVESNPEPASVMPDTEPASAPGLPNWEPTTGECDAIVILKVYFYFVILISLNM